MIYPLLAFLSANLLAFNAEQLSYYAQNDYFPELEYRTNLLIDRLDAEPDVSWLLFLDVDETMVSNLDWLSRRKFKSSLAAFNEYVKSKEGEAISSTFRLYQHAISRNIPVVIVTGRYEDQAADTKEVLRRLGYKKWEAIYFKKRDNQQVTSYKQALRCQYQQQGFAIVNVGDQLSDVSGSCQNLTLKLPNPFYSTGSIIDWG